MSERDLNKLLGKYRLFKTVNQRLNKELNETKAALEDALKREKLLRRALEGICNKHFAEYPKGHKTYCELYSPLREGVATVVSDGCTCGFNKSEARAMQARLALEGEEES